MNFASYIESKAHRHDGQGIKAKFLPDYLFPVQAHIVEWGLAKGRCAFFEDCGLGKTVQQLVWAENIARHTNKRVLILTPLAVGAQTEREAHKFGIDAGRIHGGVLPKQKICITNYEQLHKLKSSDFVACVCDESSILKNFDGKIKELVTSFKRKMPYRLLCTATAAPNDYIELGTSSEALGYLGYVDMLKTFFVNDNGTFATGGRAQQSFGGKYRFKGHSQQKFWRWVCSWARAIRRPSDLGFCDEGFVLPPMNEFQHIVKARRLRDGFLFEIPARGLAEQREEISRTVVERCEMAASIANSKDSCILWCNLNRESELLAKITHNCVEVTGSQSDEEKEEKLEAFSSGQVSHIVIKPTIGGFGLNWQHCSEQTFFPSHSFEQYYQCTRRSWRFGQKKEVNINVIATEGNQQVLSNLQRKAKMSEEMFSDIVRLMGDELNIARSDYAPKIEATKPAWL